MQQVVSSLTITFEDPFWVGIYEREEDERYEAAKVTFGAEPKDNEVYEFFLKNWGRLSFSPPLDAVKRLRKKCNPKRMRRQAAKLTREVGIGTKAQQAFKRQQEQGKLQRAVNRKWRRQEEKEARFQQLQEKKKAKHRGH